MTKLELKNNELAPAINLLQKMDLKNKDSRARSKLVTLLHEAFQGVAQEEKTLLAEHGLLDENENLIEEEKRDPKKVASFNKDKRELLDEIVIIEGGAYARNIDEIPRILNEYEGELSGEDAEIYDRLLDEFEKEGAE